MAGGFLSGASGLYCPYSAADCSGLCRDDRQRDGYPCPGHTCDGITAIVRTAKSWSDAGAIQSGITRCGTCPRSRGHSRQLGCHLCSPISEDGDQPADGCTSLTRKGARMADKLDQVKAATHDIELRTFQIQGRELRVNTTGDRPVIEGYAAVFNQYSEDLGGFVEIIDPG